MSTNVGEIDLSLILNSNKFDKQLNDVNNKANTASTKISSSLSKIGKAVATAFSVAAIVKFGKTCLDVATETSNAWIGLNSVLTGQGKSFSQAQKFINDYIADGLVPLNNAVAAYKNLTLRGYSSEQIQKTMNALKNSATFARQSTYSLGEAVQTATEGLKNENSVVVDNAGVTKNVAKMWDDYAKSIGTTRDKLTQEQKIQAEVNGILEETKFQSNDAAIYANTYSGKIAQLSSAFTNMKVAIGNVIQPLAKLFVPVITTAVNAVTRLFTALSGLMSLFGLKADSVETVSGGLSDVAESASNASESVGGIGDSASKSAKKVKKSLAGFDEINKLDDNSDSSNGGGSGAGSVGINDSLDVTTTVEEDTSKIDGMMNKLKELAGIFKEGFLSSWGDTNFDGIINHLKHIKEVVKDIFTDPKVLDSANNWVETSLYALGQMTGSVARIGVNVAEFFVGSIDKYLSQNVDRIKTFICNMFDISSREIALTGNLFQAIGEISDVFKSDIAKQIGADIIAMFANPFMSAVELVSKFGVDLKSLLFQPIIDNVDGIKTAIENTLGPIQTITGTLSEALTYIGDKFNEVYDVYISPFFDSLKTGLSDTFGKFINIYNEYVLPFLENVATGFNTLWQQHLQPLVDQIGEFIRAIVNALQVLWENWLKPLIDWIIENIIPAVIPVLESVWNTVSSVFGAIADVISGIIETFTGLINFLVGVFTGDWSKAWDGIKTIFSGIWNTIKSLLSTIWEAIKGIISTGINAIKSTISVVLNAIKTVFTNIFNAILNTVKSVISGMMSFISAGLSAIFNAFSSIFNGIWNVIKGVCNSILGGIESMVNGVINGVNTIINAFNGLHIDIPDWVPGLGGKKFGFSIPNVSNVSLPRLAQGGYVKANTPQLAVIGDNKTQGEVVAPEDKMVEMVLAALKAFKSEQQNNNFNDSSEPININLMLDSEVFQRIQAKRNDRRSLATNGRC